VIQRAAHRLCRLDGHADAETDAQAFLKRATQSLALGAGECRRWIDADQDVVETVDAAEDDLELVDAGVARTISSMRRG